ncbi:MAG: ATP-binding protein [Synergistetes bacterium]|nr:ATP-binding protein [Synergistota bacterium]
MRNGVVDIPEFVDREREKEELKAVLSGRPNLVYFVYGPINSGKTTLLMKVFEELPEEYIVFYINFRWREVSNIGELLQVLFEVKYGEGKKAVREFIKEVLKTGGRALEKFKGIPISERLFDILFRSMRKEEDVFRYLEVVFEEIVKERLKPVFVLDEMQTIREVMNAAGRPVLNGLFNFLVGMTKEKHLCHCLCSTSDCLFIEDVYSNAHLEGRAEYILVDDLSKEKAFEAYEEFGFGDKELLWDYIGGKIGDMVRVFEDKKRGYGERGSVERMLNDQKVKLKSFLEAVEEGEKGNIAVIEEVEKAFIKMGKEEREIEAEKIPRKVRLFLIQANMLFYNPLEGTVRPQSRLLWRAIREVFG